jgi:hypothetical protein
MKAKNIYAIFLVIVVCAALAYYFFKIYKPIKREEKAQEHIQVEVPQSEGGLVDESLIETKHIQKEDTYTTLNVKYPQFRNIPTLENDRIRNTYERIIKDHTALSEENFKARIETGGPSTPITTEDKYPLFADYTVIQANEDFVSVLFTYSGYQGGAHGYENVFSLNYDVKNKKMVYLRDIFKGQVDQIGFISAESRKKLLEKLLPKVTYKESFDKLVFKNDEDANLAQMIYDGTEPETDNFKVYTFTPTEVIFYFGEYQVVPYAYGRQQVTISHRPAFYGPVEEPVEEKVQ